MTASQLIAQIFSRSEHPNVSPLPPMFQADAQSQIRILTTRQYLWLCELIRVEALARELRGERPVGETVRVGEGGSLVWQPEGGYKYILAWARIGTKHTITRLRSLSTTGIGNLFVAPAEVQS